MQLRLFLGVALLALSCRSNPAIEREFHRVVNSNECLKECMKPVQESHMELSIFKRANFTDYLLNVDAICTLINDARVCIDGCGIASNPFALLSVGAICTEKSRQDAEALKPCLVNEGAQTYDQCSQICGGDYDLLNEEIHTRSSTIRPDDKDTAEQVAQQTNDICVVAKCSARCTADNLNRRCGQQSGDKLAALVERILKLHRVDLEVFGLLETVRKNTPPECSFFYTPEALFNPLKDAVVKDEIRKGHEVEAPRQDAALQMQQPNEQPKPDARALANQLYVQILKKQLQVLDKQLQVLNRQDQKLEEPVRRDDAPQFAPKLPRYFYVNDMF